MQTLRIACILGLVLFLVPRPGQAAPGPDQTKEEQGKLIVEELLARVPSENKEISGFLKIRPSSGKRIEIPIRVRIERGELGWKDIYEAWPAGHEKYQRLIIEHKPEGPNQYLLQTNGLADAQSITGEDLGRSLGGSDFWFMDLGLEFFHWPEQKLVKAEMRRGRSCKVVESTNPGTAGYKRVLSWIDHEEGGLVRAEGFDAANKLVKVFSIKSFKQIEGRWQLKEMEIRNEQTDSKTVLEYEFNPKEAAASSSIK